LDPPSLFLGKAPKWTIFLYDGHVSTTNRLGSKWRVLPGSSAAISSSSLRQRAQRLQPPVGAPRQSWICIYIYIYKYMWSCIYIQVYIYIYPALRQRINTFFFEMFFSIAATGFTCLGACWSATTKLDSHNGICRQSDNIQSACLNKVNIYI